MANGWVIIKDKKVNEQLLKIKKKLDDRRKQKKDSITKRVGQKIH